MIESAESPRRFDQPTADLIRAALDRVLSSDAFRSAPQLATFLTFIVERAISGRSAELKGYTIAVEALGRPAQFDPQVDPIVRVEAGRLRKALAHYYMAEGASDPIRIVIPVGGYVPLFESGMAAAPPDRETAMPAATIDAAHSGSTRAGLRPTIWTVPAILCLLSGLVLLAGWPYLRGVFPSGVLSETAAPLRPAGPFDLPMVAITVVETPGDPGLVDITRAFTRILVDAVARFDDLVAVRTPASGPEASDGADYVFEMNAIRSGETTEGFGVLRSVKDGRVVWTTSTSRTLERGADDPELIEVARRLAIRLAQPFGIIHADFRQATSSSATRCIFLALDVRRTMKPEDHLAARRCMEELVEQDPIFHPAWSQLAFLILDEHVFGMNPQSVAPLDRALGAALTAVRLAPSSARAQQALMDVLFARGATEDAIKAGREALARNPYDPDIMADLGSRYVQLNRPAKGMPLLERAVALSDGRPPWYDFFVFLGAHLMGSHRLAEVHSAMLVTDESPFGLLGVALRSATIRDTAGSQAALSRLAEMAPLFRLDPKLYLSRKGFSDEVTARILADLGPDAMTALKSR